MKAKILKLAGVKNEKEFYKKFPTEESFMAKYGKQLKKADNGFAGLIKPNAMPSVGMTNLANTKGFGLSKLNNVELQPPTEGFDLNTGLGALAGTASSIMGGIAKNNQMTKDIAEYKKYAKVSKIKSLAAGLKPKHVKNEYVRPEDNLISGSNPYGTGTNYLQAEDGAEIQNTYAPDVMYTDLGYEPLNDSNVKQYKKGGKLKKGKMGLDMFSGIAGQLGGLAGSALGGGTGEVGPTSEILSSIGGLASFIPGLGAIAGPIGSAVLGGIGQLFDNKKQKELKEAQDETKKNMENVAFTNNVSNLHNQYSAFAKNGGWVSNDWQPQVIASFGEHSMKDLLKPDPTMNTLRSGGHLSQDYVPVSEYGLNTGKAEHGGQYAMGGDLQVGRGSVDTLSYNPYLPNNGESIEFNGPSHKHGGIPMKYGENGVEVEGLESGQVLKDGGKSNSFTVFGNMKLSKAAANFVGDPKLAGSKYKNVHKDMSGLEAKQNKITSKATDLINNSDSDDPFELLAFNSGKAMSLGANMKLKELAQQKINLADYQNATLDLADELGVDPSKLAEGKAKFGGKFTSAPIAENGIGDISLYAAQPDTSFDFLQGIRPIAPQAVTVPYKYGYVPELNNLTVNANPANPANPVVAPSSKPSSDLKAKKSRDINWEDPAMMAVSLASPFLRYRISNPLDPSQIAPDLLSASMNQLEPVQAQTYQPMLSPEATSYSLQDQLNEITAQSRSAERLAQGNPAALAMIASQAQQAKSKVLGEQFRMNQAEKQRVAEANRNVLNDAQLKNLAIYDQQYVRQSEAKSKTKQQSIEIAKSIADKIAKNKLENIQLRVMENMYPAFNFTSDGTAYKNPFALASLGPSGSTTKGKHQLDTSDMVPIFEADEAGNAEITGYKKEKTKKNTGKNGTIVKAFKNF